MKGKSALLLASAVGLLSVVLAAQAPPPSQPPSVQRPPQTTSESQIRPGTPTFSAQVNLVTTDVIVRDDRGQFVADLKPDEIEVYEDGVLQKVVQVLLIHGGRQYSPLALAPKAPQEGIVLPPPRPTNDAAGRIFVFFIDDLHMDFRNTGRIRKLLQDIRKTLLKEGDMFCMVSSGPSSISVELTYDLKRFETEIKRVTGGGLKPSEIVEGGESQEGPTEVRYRAHVAFSVAYQLVQDLEQVHNRRKALIYVSNGYDFNPFQATRRAYQQENQPTARNSETSDYMQQDASDVWGRQGQQFAFADLARELGELTRVANRANVTIHTLDPRGLVGGPDLDEKVDPTDWADYLRTSQDTLRVLANETGGIPVVNSNDFEKALKRIDAETSDYYLLGYYSSNPDPLKKNRRIEVKAKRADLTVWARKGYQIKSAPRPTIKK